MRKKQIYSELYSKGLSQEDRIFKLTSLLKDFSAQSFLDIGCGDGSLTVFLKQLIRAKEVKAIEIAEEGANKAEEKGIECYVLDLESQPLPFQNETFDFVFCGEVIEHLFDPDLLLEEIYRVLKPHGKCIITTPNLGAWYNRISLLLGYQPYSVPASFKNYAAGKIFGKSSGAGREHIRFFTLRALKVLLEAHKFRIKKVVGAYTKPFYAPFPFSFVYNMERFFSNFPTLATNILVLIEK